MLFLLLYNVGEAQIQRVLPLFLMSHVTQGGLAYTNHQVGLVFGIYGTMALSVGALLSGKCVVRWGLRRSLWWMTAVMVFTNVGYLWIAANPSGRSTLMPMIIIIAQASFGLANSAYMCVLLQVSKDKRYALTWYALASALMAMGMMFPGMLSGVLLSHFSFMVTFSLICAMSLLSFLVVGMVKVP